ncbi:hypothetical protein HY229_08030 [Candidatus Acetothermia bacterium]|nr:hypothetical protein [Candidatus Acetothermia bacterium]MBI3644028.1 hypothetical protein [Candidatus Acetothermia bacterium]
MSACVYCHHDRGRRSCPVLGGLISTTCCGRHRGVEIACPSQCRYFKEHEEYQRARLSLGFHEAWLKATAQIYDKHQSELLNWIIFFEISIYEYFHRNTRGTDEDLIEAFSFVKHKLSPLEIIETVGSELERHLWASTQAYLKSHPELDENLAKAGIEVFEALIRMLKGPAEPRQALHGLLGHIETYIGVPEEIAKASKESPVETPKIILPGR